jgi:catechol 2,3-dioxygenase-like lactoylglutathione lyase family enzyme
MITLGVGDLPAAVKFYQRSLGFARRESSPFSPDRRAKPRRRESTVDRKVIGIKKYYDVLESSRVRE